MVCRENLQRVQGTKARRALLRLLKHLASLARSARETGCDDYLPKPCQPKTISEAVTRVLARR